MYAGVLRLRKALADSARRRATVAEAHAHTGEPRSAWRINTPSCGPARRRRPGHHRCRSRPASPQARPVLGGGGCGQPSPRIRALVVGPPSPVRRRVSYPAAASERLAVDRPAGCPTSRARNRTCSSSSPGARSRRARRRPAAEARGRTVPVRCRVRRARSASATALVGGRLHANAVALKPVELPPEGACGPPGGARHRRPPGAALRPQFPPAQFHRRRPHACVELLLRFGRRTLGAAARPSQLPGRRPRRDLLRAHAGRRGHRSHPPPFRAPARGHALGGQQWVRRVRAHHRRAFRARHPLERLDARPLHHRQDRFRGDEPCDPTVPPLRTGPGRGPQPVRHSRRRPANGEVLGAWSGPWATRCSRSKPPGISRPSDSRSPGRGHGGRSNASSSAGRRSRRGRGRCRILGALFGRVVGNDLEAAEEDGPGLRVRLVPSHNVRGRSRDHPTGDDSHGQRRRRGGTCGAISTPSRSIVTVTGRLAGPEHDHPLRRRRHHERRARFGGQSPIGRGAALREGALLGQEALQGLPPEERTDSKRRYPPAPPLVGTRGEERSRGAPAAFPAPDPE